MIFRPDQAKLILQAKKTQTRRRKGDRNVCRFEAWKPYAVQPGRGKTAVCKITITDVREERLGDLTLKDARREGFATCAEFFEDWRQHYGRIDDDERVWVVSFLLGDRTDTPRFLAARPGPPHGDYVTEPALAAQGEGEPVSDYELSQFTKIAHARDHGRSQDPLRQSRDRIAREIEVMRGHLERDPNNDVRNSLRRLEAELAALNRKLAA